MYSLNERQIKKLRIIFDYNKPLKNYKIKYDKTICFLKFLVLEVNLLRYLLQLCDKSNFEHEIKKIIDDRLITLNKVFASY